MYTRDERNVGTGGVSLFARIRGMIRSDVTFAITCAVRIHLLVSNPANSGISLGNVVARANGQDTIGSNESRLHEAREVATETEIP